jgi:hypothetical protein
MSNGQRSTTSLKSSPRGMNRLAEARLRRALRRTACSEPWVDAQFYSVIEDDGREEQVRRVHDPRVFPPGGAQTRMKRCPRCGVFTPPTAFESGICLDHAENGSWGRSPSAAAIAALQHFTLRLVDPPLPSESIPALRAEIAAFEKKHRSAGTAEKESRKKGPVLGKAGKPRREALGGMQPLSAAT